MPCDVCNYTFSENYIATDLQISWCPRCGSLEKGNKQFRRVEKPILVTRIEKAAHVPAPESFGSNLIHAVVWRAILEAAGIKT